MKKLLLLALLTLGASVAYAGSSCCGVGGEKDDKKTEKTEKSGKSEFQSSSTTLAQCGDACSGDKDKSKETKSGLQDATGSLLAGGDRSKGGCGDKDKGDASRAVNLTNLA
ncbi:MAG: hypothetical protein ACLFS1_01815 [Opitutales bacterium]